MKVYLAGGFKSGWQTRVRQEVPEHTYVDPSLTGLTNPAAYTAWDLDAIESCDAVFAYLEESNPGGMNLAFELGYAVALNKVIVLVDEKDDRYSKMLVETADHYTGQLVSGINWLKKHALTHQRKIRPLEARVKELEQAVTRIHSCVSNMPIPPQAISVPDLFPAGPIPWQPGQ